LNLPSQRKMDAPWSRDFAADEIPEYVTPEGVTVRVIAGSSNGVGGAVTREFTEPLYLDIHLPPGGKFSTALPDTHNAFVYVYRGTVNIEGTAVASHHMGVFANTTGSDGVAISASDAARLILVAGKPLKEPIVQYGPFVMNTQAEIVQAVEDYRAGRFAA
jgi:redox-sensitive bicupin YhaK (pirin superfamily)